MTRYLLKRILMLFPLMIFITFFAFVLLTMRASDPAEVALRVNQVTPTEEMIESMRQELGLDQPFFIRYATWLKNGLTGDFGRSYVTQEPVFDLIMEAAACDIAACRSSALFYHSAQFIVRGDLCICCSHLGGPFIESLCVYRRFNA